MSKCQKYQWYAAAGALSLSMVLSAPGAHAQSSEQPSEQSSEGLEEIVVTAQRVSEPLQEVPAAVTAISSSDLQKSGVMRMTDMTSRVPNLQVSRNQGVTNYSMRGIGNTFLNLGGDASVAVHQNGIYVARPRAQVTAFFDIERIEVLRGPQGTLYGRNATGGSINVVTREPGDVLEGNATLTVGNYGRVRLEGGISAPIVQDKISARLAVLGARHDGYGDNVVTGKEIDDLDERAVRLTIRFTPSDMFEYVVTGDHYYRKDNGNPWHYLGQGRPDTVPVGISAGGFAASDIRDVADADQSYMRAKVSGVAGTGTLKVSDNLTLKMMTAYRHSKSDSSSDADGTSLKLLRADHYEVASQFSHELQAIYQDDRLKAVGGLYYFNEKVSGSTKVPLFFIDPSGALFAGSGPAKGSTDAYAAYLHLAYELLDGLTVTGAVRFSSETRSASGSSGGRPLPDYAVGKRTWKETTPRVAIDYKVNDNVMVYASASKGFKSGSFLIGAKNPPVEPESVWAYEAGLKSELFDRHLRLNVAAFKYDYTDLQVSRTVNNSTLTENAASSRIKGIELEAVALPWRGAKVNLNATWLDAKFKDFATADSTFPELGNIDLAGKRLPYSPEFAFNVSAEQAVDLGQDNRLIPSVEFIWTDDLYLDAFNRIERGQSSNGILNARLTYQPSNPHWSLSVWGRNLTDKTVKTTTTVSAGAVGFPLFGSLNDPFTFGADLSVSF